MRILIGIAAGVVAGLGARMFMHPTVQEITAPAPSYSESHAETVKMAEEKAAVKTEREPPLNPAYPEQLHVRGYIVLNDRVNVCLSDGTVWTEKTGGLERLERSHVVFRGKSYAIMGAGAAPVRPAAVERTERASPASLDMLSATGLSATGSGEAAPQKKS